APKSHSTSTKRQTSSCSSSCCRERRCVMQADTPLQIPYRRAAEYEPVDVARLRPAGSYQQLIAKRTHPIDELVRVHASIPEDLLTPRACPTCGGQDAMPELTKDHMAIVRCATCDLVYVSPTFDEVHYKSVYASSEYQEIVRDLGIKSHEYRVARFGAERVGL